MGKQQQQQQKKRKKHCKLMFTTKLIPTFLWFREGCIGFPSSQYTFLTFNSKIWDTEIKWIVQFYVDFKIYKI